MTIETIRKRSDDRADFLITCNETDCCRSLDAKDRTFQQAVTFLRAKGGRAYKSFGTWMHSCPPCGAKKEAA